MVTQDIVKGMVRVDLVIFEAELPDAVTGSPYLAELLKLDSLTFGTR